MRGKSVFVGFLSVFLLSFLLVNSVAYAMFPSCAFGGAVTDINGTSVEGTEVTVYLQDTGEPVGTGMTTSSGYGIAVVNASEEYVIFKVSGDTADQSPQYCDGEGEFTLLDLSVTDGDGDGYGQYDDCNDANETISPGADEICDDGIDNDCDGFIDLNDTDCIDIDEDGYSVADGDCNDTNPDVNPGVSEACNGIDDDCDELIDEDASDSGNYTLTSSCYTGPAGTQGVGICKAGTKTCTELGWGSCSGEVTPGTETCNSQDDDCDGSVDEDGVCGGGGGGSGGSGGTGGSSYSRVCGDKVCFADERCGGVNYCPEDCGECEENETEEQTDSTGSTAAVCGNDVCETAFENCATCPEDCGCAEGEYCSTEEKKCVKPVCGDGTCEEGEDCSLCPEDCGACYEEQGIAGEHYAQTTPTGFASLGQAVKNPWNLLALIIILSSVYLGLKLRKKKKKGYSFKKK